MAQAQAITERLARGVSEGLQGFRKQDKYYKAQAGILVGWVVSSLLTAATVFWAGRTQNKLGADVRAETPIGGTVLLVTNTSDSAWTDITYTLNGIYVARRAAVAAHDHDSLPIRRFRKGGVAGKHLPRDLVPQVISIHCEQGQFQAFLSGSAGPGRTSPAGVAGGSP